MTGYDVRCEDLARVYLPDGPEEDVQDLAQTIQDAIEDWFDESERTS